MTKRESETVTTYISLEWYDGPLLEIARVDFSDRDAMIQVCSLCTVHPEETDPSSSLRGAVSGEAPWERATIRLTRSDLLKMLDLIDGKPIEDFHDEMRHYPLPPSNQL
jgi:hypothetical protein